MTITDFAALSIRLPELDRATLSQAWRDALHQTESRSPIPSQARNYDKPFRDPHPSAARTDARITKHEAHIAPTFRASAKRSIGFVDSTSARKMHCRNIAIPSPHRQARRIVGDRFFVQLPGGERVCVVVARRSRGVVVTIFCATHLQDHMHSVLTHLGQMLGSVRVQVTATGGVA
jgi:hypothetical protein